ncbi:hypothetical protein PsYK624_097630 [Phanerochaete sordida]|uniref:Amine oxidase domain-containing protein n=1 Tax=Phanerochaete sordida TaxID=48140 RepID=A0A9P3GCJ0_9APHY|nr:hypothetical protein PsYK624_097630 [Phanerochaete sordida]
MFRRVIYPSYGGDDGSRSTVLMVSYALDADALPWMGLLGKEREAFVKRKVISDLLAIHKLTNDARDRLEREWKDAYLWSWNADPNTLGAFAFFYPGQFAELYTHLTQPAGQGRLHFAGEVVSTRHGWVVGALNASSRAVSAILAESYPDKFEDFSRKPGLPEAWTKRALEEHIGITSIGEWSKPSQ